MCSMYTRYVKFIKYTRVNIVWFDRDQLFLLVHPLKLSFEKYVTSFYLCDCCMRNAKIEYYTSYTCWSTIK